MLNKCCLCWDLKFGYLWFSIITLAGRFCTIFTLHYYLTLTYGNGLVIDKGVSAGVGFSIGYLVFSVACLCLSIKGIIQKNSILMLPYANVLILEVTVSTIFQIALAVSTHFVTLPALFLSNFLHGYIILHHFSLYKLFKKGEEEEKERRARANENETETNPSAPLCV